VLYIVLTMAGVYGCMKLEIDFKITFFVDPDAYVNNYLSSNDEYFGVGPSFTIYVEDETTDYSSIANQV